MPRSIFDKGQTSKDSYKKCNPLATLLKMRCVYSTFGISQLLHSKYWRRVDAVRALARR